MQDLFSRGVASWDGLGGGVGRARAGMKGAASTKSASCGLEGRFFVTLFELNTWAAPRTGPFWLSSRTDHCPQCGNKFRTTLPSTINFAGYAIVAFKFWARARQKSSQSSPLADLISDGKSWCITKCVPLRFVVTKRGDDRSWSPSLTIRCHADPFPAESVYPLQHWSYSTVRKYSKPYLRTLGIDPRDTLPYLQISFDWDL